MSPVGIKCVEDRCSGLEGKLGKRRFVVLCYEVQQSQFLTHFTTNILKQISQSPQCVCCHRVYARISKAVHVFGLPFFRIFRVFQTTLCGFLAS
jgi:hypothetical protein